MDKVRTPQFTSTSQELIMLLVYFALILSICGLSQTASGPIIQIPLGKLLGWERLSRSGRVYQAWTSVPYGQPPIGNLRLMAPLPAKKWKGVYNATKDMPYCMQIPFEAWTFADFHAREDCLYLNVYKPKESANKSMPVIVYLFGGANMRGYVERRWNADYLMDEDIVLVEPNFRLNGFGLLSLGDNVIPGNYMHKDQVLVLKWVKQNIMAFDGNPDQIIVLGESSGSTATHFLLTSPASRDLIAGGVSHSGSINHMEAFPQDGRVKEYSLKIIRHVDCERETSEEILYCLQQLDAFEFTRASLWEADNPIHLNLGLVIEPEDVDDAFITEDISANMSTIPWINTVANGELVTIDISLRFSPNYAEEAYSDTHQHLTDWLSKQFNDSGLVEDKVNKLMNRYFSEEEPLANFSMALSKMYTDAEFMYSAIHNSLEHNGPVWLGYLEYKSDQSPLAFYPYNPHAMNMDFYFNRTGPYPWSIPESPRDLIASKRFIRYLVNFAYYLDPTPPGSNYTWAQYGGNEILRMGALSDFIGDESFVDEMMDLYRFWKDIIGW